MGEDQKHADQRFDGDGCIAGTQRVEPEILDGGMGANGGGDEDVQETGEVERGALEGEKKGVHATHDGGRQLEEVSGWPQGQAMGERTGFSEGSAGAGAGSGSGSSSSSSSSGATLPSGCFGGGRGNSERSSQSSS